MQNKIDGHESRLRGLKQVVATLKLNILMQGGHRVATIRNFWSVLRHTDSMWNMQRCLLKCTGLRHDREFSVCIKAHEQHVGHAKIFTQCGGWPFTRWTASNLSRFKPFSP